MSGIRNVQDASNHKMSLMDERKRHAMHDGNYIVAMVSPDDVALVVLKMLTSQNCD